MWHTYGSDAQQTIFVEYIMITNLTESYAFTWNELATTQDEDNLNRNISNIYIVYDLNNPMEYFWLTSENSSKIIMPSCAQDLTTFYSPFHLFVFVPVSQVSNWILFGELNKQLPITQQRFDLVQFSFNTTDRLDLHVIGVSGEQVSITIGHTKHVFEQVNIYTVQCLFQSISEVSTMIVTCEIDHGCSCHI
ncbi:hypothetical protein I4U23_001493 [Adineta vaga]|nr:hypothetical protein I4U23_001493 [Adineta vaga]